MRLCARVCACVGVSRGRHMAQFLLALHNLNIPQFCSFLEIIHRSLVHCNNVVTPKSSKMGLLHLFNIQDEIFKGNFKILKFDLEPKLLRAILSQPHGR